MPIRATVCLAVIVLLSSCSSSQDNSPGSSVSINCTTPTTGDPGWPWQDGSSGDDFTQDIASDSEGNIYLSAQTSGDLEVVKGGGALLYKFSPQGAKQWVCQLGGTVSDYRGGLEIDTADNIYAAWRSGGVVFLAKLDSAGNVLWAKKWDYGFNVVFTEIAANGYGNIFLVGEAAGDIGGGTTGMFFWKLDGSGNTLWVRQMAGSEYIYAADVDASGNLYVAGEISGGFDGHPEIGARDIFLVKFNSDGVKQWSKLLGTTGLDLTQGMAIDTFGVNLAYNSTGGYLTRFDFNGNELWTFSTGDSSDSVRDIAADGFGSYYLTGSWDGTSPSNMIVVKVDTAGSETWRIEPATSGYDIGSKVLVDSFGDIYIGGHSWGDFTGDGNPAPGLNIFDLVLLKYNATGTQIVSPP